MIVGMKKVLIGGAVALAMGTGAAAAGEYKSIPAPEGHPLPEIISGYEFRTPETQALQNDDFENPGMLWVENGSEIWNVKEGAAGKACADCHGADAEDLADAGTHFPKWNAKMGKPVNLESQINLCRTNQMQADAWKLESGEMLAMTAFVRNKARGKPVNVDLTQGDMQAWADKGKEMYYTRFGQLDMSCANCHEDNYGNYIRSDHLSQGQTNGFPLYRLKWQKVGSIHRRFKGCMNSIRAEPYKPGGDEFLALEVYVAYRGVGLPIETPAVRQ